LIIDITKRRAAIAEKADINATAISKEKGRKNVLRAANNFISPAPILNFKKSGEERRARRAL